MKRTFPPHGSIGLGLVGTFWVLNWGLDGLRTHWCFFPLWLGYCLVVDGLCVRRSGTSLLTRSRGGYLSLFLLSIPVWWLFEAVNSRTQNWHYVGRDAFGNVEYALFASLSFSTVIPAVLGTAEWIGGGAMRRFRRGPVLAAGPGTASKLFVVGLLMLVLLLVWPRVFYPFVWISFYCLFESLNLRAGNVSLLDWTARGDWRPVVSLALGALVCGFFWEMWNIRSHPRWVYDVPFFGFWHVFEMPLAGYLGYVPFSFELFAVVHLVFGWLGRGRSDYVAFVYGSAP